MVVGIELADRRRHRALLLRRLGVLLAQVPVEGQQVAEAGHELAAVEPPLDAERRRRPGASGIGPPASPVAEAVVVVLGLLHLEVEEEAQRLGVVQDDLPLVELRAVVVELVVAGDEGPHVVAVAPGVVGEEGDGVRAPWPGS